LPTTKARKGIGLHAEGVAGLAVAAVAGRVVDGGWGGDGPILVPQVAAVVVVGLAGLGAALGRRVAVGMIGRGANGRIVRSDANLCLRSRRSSV